MMSANPARWAGHSDTIHFPRVPRVEASSFKDREPLCSFNHVSILLRPLGVQCRFMMMRSSEEYAAVRLLVDPFRILRNTGNKVVRTRTLQDQ